MSDIRKNGTSTRLPPAVIATDVYRKTGTGITRPQYSNQYLPVDASTVNPIRSQDAMNAERPYPQEEKLWSYAAATGLIIILTAIIALQWSDVQRKPVFTMLFLVFSALFIGNASIEKGNPRRTHLYVAVQSLLAILMTASNPALAIMFFYPLSLQAVLKIDVRSGLIWVGAFALITVAVHWYAGERIDNTFLLNATVACGGFFFLGMFGSVLAGIRQHRERIRQLAAELNHANSQLQEYAKKIESTTATAERERIARELHDTLGYRLTVSLVQLEGGGRLMKEEPARAADMIATVRTQLLAGMDELRYTLHRLRAHNINSDNLIHSLQELSDTFAKSTGLALHLQLPDALRPRLSDDQSMAVYRIVQEALTNTHKHAQAENVWVAMDTNDNALNLRIRNDGKDFVPRGTNGEGEGHGLRGMRERAAQIGGALHVTKPAEGGALVTFSQPLRETTAEYV